MKQLPRVALLIESSREYGRGLLRGIIRYQKEHTPWSIYFQPRGSNEPLPGWLRRWKGDGILARIENRQMAKLIEQSGIPAVDLRFAVKDLNCHGVGIDNQTVVRRVFEHFTSRGFRRFGVCGYASGRSYWLDVREKLFLDMAAENGIPCQRFEPRVAIEQSWEQEQKQIVSWLKKLGKNVAVFAVNDERGQQVIDACRRAEINVPDEIAIAGVGNDEFLCGLSTPPMTSVDINVEGIGYRAAQLLVDLMHGQKCPRDPILLSAGQIVPRRSTDAYAVEDQELLEILRYLRENACRGIRIEDISKEMKMERRTLERRVKAALGRSPKEEISRIQMEEACQLLARTEMSIKNVAISSGFANSRYFSRVFRMRNGTTPHQYRVNVREDVKI